MGSVAAAKAGTTRARKMLAMRQCVVRGRIQLALCLPSHVAPGLLASGLAREDARNNIRSSIATSAGRPPAVAQARQCILIPEHFTIRLTISGIAEIGGALSRRAVDQARALASHRLSTSEGCTAGDRVR